jgi:hypothetical protein
MWSIFPPFGILCQEKSGNPGCINKNLATLPIIKDAETVRFGILFPCQEWSIVPNIKTQMSVVLAPRIAICIFKPSFIQNRGDLTSFFSHETGP